MPSTPRSPSASRVLLGGLLVLSVVVSGVAIASPAPISVCQLCGRQLTDSADRHGIPLDVQRSTATVTVHWNGSATWTVRNSLGNATSARRLRADGTLRADLVRDIIDSRGYASQDATLVGTQVTANGTFVVRYRVADVAERTSGVLRVDYFREDPGQYIYTGLGADRLTVVGPSGTRVTSGIPTASVEGNRLTLHRWPDGTGGWFVVFGPSDGVLGGAAAEVGTGIAIAQSVADIVVGNLVLVALLPGLVLTGVLYGIARAIQVGIEPSVPGTRRYGSGIAGIALLGIGAPWYPESVPVVGGSNLPPPVEGVVLVASVTAFLIAVTAVLGPDRFEPRKQIVTIAVGAVCGGLLLATTGVLPSEGHSVPESALIGGLVVLAVPIGYTTRHGDRRTVGRVLVTMPSFAVLGASAIFPMTTAHRTAFLLAVFGIGSSLLVAVVVSPLLVLGTVLPGSTPARERTE